MALCSFTVSTNATAAAQYAALAPASPTRLDAVECPSLRSHVLSETRGRRHEESWKRTELGGVEQGGAAPISAVSMMLSLLRNRGIVRGPGGWRKT